MGTYSAKKQDIERTWYIVDASGKTLGRLASTIASVLRGKIKPIFTTHVDTGDFVIVVNAEKVFLSGRKLDQKVYYRHSGYPGGLKTASAAELRKKKPERIIEAAVWGMLPKGRLGRAMFRKLKVYPGPSHPHRSQKPDAVAIQ